MDFLAGTLVIGMWITAIAAWITALAQSAAQEAWVLFATCLIAPPWGVLVGIGAWIGVW